MTDFPHFPGNVSGFFAQSDPELPQFQQSMQSVTIEIVEHRATEKTTATQMLKDP
jgi:hypothetical protein